MKKHGLDERPRILIPTEPVKILPKKGITKAQTKQLEDMASEVDKISSSKLKSICNSAQIEKPIRPLIDPHKVKILKPQDEVIVCQVNVENNYVGKAGKKGIRTNSSRG